MSPAGADSQQQAMMSVMMPVMFTAFSLFLPSGLALYMLTSYLHEALRHAALPASESLPRLTSQERACLHRAFSGLNDSEIAERLKITSRTVRFHLGNVRQKLGATSRSQMVAKAVLLGLVAA